MRSHSYTFCTVIANPFCKLKAKGLRYGGK
ncbi:hypothetical protein mEp554_33 [Escherichia phage mEp554]